ncbi:Ppx/GppA family phosphatase [Actinobacteria bacterium YIM 96077]|uniref:Ppx/GppA family phosphatase n=1 Tax=Phytoactinopolyspora halophila TaxID=1981511 RepID=A0A329QP68_9ACTN|nr:Ppx/GppA phosphatase family protein [Phytoactinopolyspora halophila]AYY15726.1 Ppx/GppA family phosphatase [Actinobacteria bacterium YIM 96077]RAW13152.1 Ppx/GppA family phosphatase [Phytoactinopolyspora halophila]
MRIAVLDVGSNTVHLLLVDAHRGAKPLPAHKEKADLRLVDVVSGSDAATSAGADRLVEYCRYAAGVAEDKGATSMLAFATSALRESAIGEQIIERVRHEAGVDLTTLSGEDEARLTFLAVRRWYGWSAGRLLSFDIGGGSLELAMGIDEDPDVALSLPLGAARLTQEWFTTDPPSEDELRELRRHVRAEIADVVGKVHRFGLPDHAVASSKTFRSLARIAGAAPSADGPYVRRTLRHADAQEIVSRLAEMPAAERAKLAGVPRGRSEQLLAGAVVADAAMDLFDVESVDICPWALREGMILRRLDHLDSVENPPAR